MRAVLVSIVHGSLKFVIMPVSAPQRRRAQTDDRDDYYLLDKIDTSEQVHSEIDEGPVDALPFVLFLLEYEHVVVKELLQLLIGEVNAELLESVVLFLNNRKPE